MSSTRLLVSLESDKLLLPPFAVFFYHEEEYTDKQEDSPEVVSFTENKIGFDEESRSNFSESTITASTLEAVFMPDLIQCFQ
jgi:hypothetical protein